MHNLYVILKKGIFHLRIINIKVTKYRKMKISKALKIVKILSNRAAVFVVFPFLIILITNFFSQKNKHLNFNLIDLYLL
jgi:hypothetical protein